MDAEVRPAVHRVRDLETRVVLLRSQAILRRLKRMRREQEIRAAVRQAIEELEALRTVKKEM